VDKELFDFALVPATHVGEVRVYIADQVEFTWTRKYYAYSTLGRFHIGRMTRWTGPYDKLVDLNSEPTPYATGPTVSAMRDVRHDDFGVTATPKRPLFGRWEPGSSPHPTPRWGAAEQRGVEFFFPHFLVAAAFALLPTVRLAAATRRWRRVRRGLCPSCGYNLTGNVSGVCPECGTRARLRHGGASDARNTSAVPPRILSLARDRGPPHLPFVE
jgi:hypothetical protein